MEFLVYVVDSMNCGSSSLFFSAIVGLTRGGVAADGTVEDPAAQKSLIAFVCIYIAAFASTWGPIAWYVSLHWYNPTYRCPENAGL